MQPELPERTGAMVGAAQQELDYGRDTATARDAGQSREKGRNALLPSPFLLPCSLLSVRLWAKSHHEARGQGILSNSGTL